MFCSQVWILLHHLIIFLLILVIGLSISLYKILTIPKYTEIFLASRGFKNMIERTTTDLDLVILPGDHHYKEEVSCPITCREMNFSSTLLRFPSEPLCQTQLILDSARSDLYSFSQICCNHKNRRLALSSQ